MRQIILSPEAAQDIRETWNFIAQDNLDAADNWQQQIEAGLNLLAQMPSIGRVRHEFSLALRSWVKAGHVIFYQYHETRIDVFRVLHHARDIETIIESQLSGG